MHVSYNSHAIIAGDRMALYRKAKVMTDTTGDSKKRRHPDLLDSQPKYGRTGRNLVRASEGAITNVMTVAP